MPMTPTEVRELRAAPSEALDPLYAARTGTIPALDGVTRAVRQLHLIDTALLGIIRRAETGDCSPAAALDSPDRFGSASARDTVCNDPSPRMEFPSSRIRHSNRGPGSSDLSGRGGEDERHE